jgi:hypothetical protein
MKSETEEEKESNLHDEAHSLVGREEFAPLWIVLHPLEGVLPSLGFRVQGSGSRV